jgi:SAM-dependent methyltransferase
MEYLTFGPALQRRRCEFLDQTASHRAVLILGDGDGRFTAEFLRCNKTASVDSFECSESMSRLAAGRIARLHGSQSRVRQLGQDIRAAQLSGTYDLVITHFFLDCFTTEELEELVPPITAHLQPCGRWLISEFQIPSRGLSRYVAKLVIKLLYLGFAVLTGLKPRELPDYRRVLQTNGYRRTDSRTGLAGMLVSEIWELP